MVITLSCMTTVYTHAQESSMQALIGQSLSKLRGSTAGNGEATSQQPSPEAFLNCIAELKRIDAMFPDSIQPKYQTALNSLYFSVLNPHAPQTEDLLTETERSIAQMNRMKGSDPSDIFTLTGFLYMVRIVQNPAMNGQRYYRDVMENYEKALKQNPDNALAKQLQQQFLEGMRKATGK